MQPEKKAFIYFSLSAMALLALMVVDRYLGRCFSIQISYMFPIIVFVRYINRVQSIIVGIIVALIWYALRTNYTVGGGLNLLMSSLILGISVALILIVIIYFKERYEYESQIADTDELTGISNRRYFNEMLDLEFQRGQRTFQHFSVAYIDIDNFKALNDNYGHHKGDKALKLVAHILSKNTREFDVCARIGGDEFVMLLPGLFGEEVRDRFINLNNMLKDMVKEHRWPISFSIGVVTFNELPGVVAEISKITDKVMYTVKSSTKDSILFKSYPD